MLKIVLIRPGATDYDRQGRIQGSLDMPLCESGVRDAQRVAGDLLPLGIEVVYHSLCQPAAQTADLVGKALGVKVKELDKMRNLNHGLWQGMLVDEVKRKQPTVYRQWQEQPESVCPPEGETLAAARERVRPAMTKLLKKHKSGVVGLVMPEPLVSLVREHLGSGELGDLWRAAAAQPAWEVIHVQPAVAHTS